MSLKLEKIQFAYPKARGSFQLFCKSLTLEPQSITILSGPNGSGKSTALKIASGILTPNEGTVIIDDASMTGASLGAYGRMVGYLFQEPARQLFGATVLEELTFVSDLMGSEQEDTLAKAHELLDRFGLSPLERRNVFHLSRGEKQRLALCAILMQNPRYVLLDEPTTGLDDDNVAVLRHLVQDLKERGISIAIITHDAQLLELADARVTVCEGVVSQ